MEAELVHADGRTDGHDKANSRFFAILQMRLKIEGPDLTVPVNLYKIFVQDICTYVTLHFYVITSAR